MIPEYMNKDRAVAIAYCAAVCAASDEAGENKSHLWPVLFGAGIEGEPAQHLDQAGMDLAFKLALEIYAPLVRRSPDVPPEALYRHGRELRAHVGPADGWREQPWLLRLAFTIFAQALVIADRAIAAEAAEQAPARDPRRAQAGAGRRSAIRKLKNPLSKAVVAPKATAKANQKKKGK